MAEYILGRNIPIMRLLVILTSLILLAGCRPGESTEPIAGAESSVPAEGSLYESKEETGEEAESASPSTASEPTFSNAWDRFEEITNRPLQDWTTEDLKELLSMSNQDLNVDLGKHIGGRNYVFWTFNTGVNFPNGSFDLEPSEYPRGEIAYMSYTYTDKEDRTPLYPDAVAFYFLKHDLLLGGDLGGSLRDLMGVYGDAEIEYVVRGGGVKYQVYFVRYPIDDLVFLFECGITGDLTEIPPHPPLPTIDDILDSNMNCVYILQKDNCWLEQLDAASFHK
jgi:hypothetical protein